MSKPLLYIFFHVIVLVMFQLYFSEATSKTQVINNLHKHMRNIAKLSVKLDNDLATALTDFKNKLANLPAVAAKELNGILIPLYLIAYRVIQDAEEAGNDLSSCSSPVDKFFTIESLTMGGEFLSCVTEQIASFQKLKMSASSKVNKLEKELLALEAKPFACSGNYLEEHKCYEELNIIIKKLSTTQLQIFAGIFVKVQTAIDTINNNLSWCVNNKITKVGTTASDTYFHEFILCAAMIGVP